MINAAMIGLGWWGKHSIDSIKMSEKIKITGACSRNTENHKDFLSENGLHLYKTYQEVLNDKSIDAVILTTPHSMHAEQIIAAAEHDKHVFTEKPLTLTKADAVRCLDAIKNKK